jgi:putative MFS transporter
MPATQRGQFLSRIYLIQTVLLAAVGFASLPILQLGPIGWRLLFGFAALVIVAVLAFTDRRLPESPRWLVDHAQLDRARRIVAELEARAYKRVGGAPPTYEEVIDGLGRSSPEDSEDVAFPTLALLRPPYVSRMLMVLGFWFLFYFPVYAYLSYTPLIFKALGETETNALLETVLGRVAPLLVFAFLFFFVERIQRRLLIFAGVGLIALGLLLIISGLGTVGALIGSVVITAGISLAVAPAYIYTAEVFPTRARASATAIGDGIGHLGGAVQPFLFLPVLNSFGPVTAVIMLVVVLGASGACILAGVNTRSKTLTELAAA